MANIRQLKQRIRTVQNVSKITNALQLVAASRMRRAQQRATAARPYAERLRAVLANLAAQSASAEELAEAHPLVQQREGGRITLILFNTNRGLSGSLPGNINRRAAQFLLEQGGTPQIVAVGRKGRDFFQRAGARIIAEFTDLKDYPDLADTLPISEIAVEEFLADRTDRVFLLYPEFVNTVTQRPTVRQILPIETPTIEEGQSRRQQVEYIYEPGPNQVLEALLPRYVDTLVYAAALEAAASEQSARFVSMKNATDAANDMVDSLRLTLNKARQEQITKELLDIVGGVAAVEG
jgi:F-type H+-transporting ATPase subunit gamma